MSLLRQITHGMRVLLHRDAADRDLDEEVHHFYDEAVASLTASGMSETEARRVARLQLGSRTVVREEVRSQGWEDTAGRILSDLRFAARGMRSRAGFSLVVVLTLALGIGATTAIFSAVKPILFEPLPYPDGSRIFSIWDKANDNSPVPLAFGTYHELHKRTSSFAALAAMKPWQATLMSSSLPERLNGQRVSASYFRALGVKPVLGRDFEDAEDVARGPNVVILSDELWRSRFSADPRVVGSEIKLNDLPYTVVGVMARSFENVLLPSALLWAPLQYDSSLPGFQSREWGHHLQVIARLRADRSAEAAASEIAVIAQRPTPEIARPQWASMQNGMLITSLRDDVTRGVKPALVAVLGAVMLLLVIACVNVTNLLLARGAQRRGEFAMRAALGAGRKRLMQQLLTESFLFAAVGGALGMVIARVGIRALIALSPPGLPRLSAIGLDAGVLLFAIVVTTAVGLIVGLVPALQTSKGDLHTALSRGSRRMAGEHQTARRFLVVAEVSLALVLLVGAGLLLRSLQQLFAVNVGFNSERVVTMQVVTSLQRFESDQTRYQYFERALAEVQRVPGVVSAAFTSQLPLSGDIDGYGVRFERTYDPNGGTNALRYAVTPDYFRTMGIPLLRGRLIGPQDVGGAPRVVLLNDSHAKRAFPKGDALGQRLRMGPDEGDWYTVVGIVGDVTQASLAAGTADAAYFAPPQWHWVDNVMSLVVRTTGDEAALIPSIKRAIWSVDKDQPIIRIATMNGLLATSESQRRFAMILFESFALVALVLAAIGIYGLLSGTVTERFREIGVRAALGASRLEVVTLILGQGMKLTVIGILLGIGIAAAATRTLSTLLYGITLLDFVTYAGVIVLLGAVSATACTLPAWRASRIDPSITLRAE